MGGRAQPVLDDRRRRLGAALSEGYSGTPLARKLGIAEGKAFAVVADPGHVDELVVPLPAGASRVDDPAEADVVLCFVTARAELEEGLAAVAERLPNLELNSAAPVLMGHSGIRRITGMSVRWS